MDGVDGPFTASTRASRLRPRAWQPRQSDSVAQEYRLRRKTDAVHPQSGRAITAPTARQPRQSLVAASPSATACAASITANATWSAYGCRADVPARRARFEENLRSTGAG